jgi:hypothetical protein
VKPITPAALVEWHRRRCAVLSREADKLSKPRKATPQALSQRQARSREARSLAVWHMEAAKLVERLAALESEE